MKTKLPPKCTVRAIPGRFTSDTKANQVFGNVAVLVACAGIRNEPVSYTPAQGEASMVVYCVARESFNGIAPEDLCAELAGYCASALVGHRFAAPVIKTAENIVIANMHSYIGENTGGYFVWSVSWTQKIELPVYGTTSPLHELHSIHTTIAQGDAATPDLNLTLESLNV